eukprot:m.290729 g.290729  ORF g.290729 m.290729 type:complete len:438 (-) comp55084_c0_seq6:305-1618(-)
MSAESSAPTDADSCESSTESVPPPPQLLRLQSGTPGQTPARSAFDHLPPCRDHDRALHSAETVSVKVEPTEPLGAHSANASVHFRKPLQWAAADNSKFQKLNQGTLPSTHVQAAPPTARFILPFSAPMAPASCSYPSFVPALPAQNPALQIPFHQDLPPLVRCPFPLPLAHAAWPSVPPCGSFAGDLAFPLVPIQLATFPLFVTEPISAQSPTVLIPRRPVPPHSDSSLSSAAQEDAGLQHSENTSQTPPLRKGKTQTSGKQTLKIVRREFLDGSQRLYCCDLCSRRGMCRYSPGVIVHYSEAAPGTLGTYQRSSRNELRFLTRVLICFDCYVQRNSSSAISVVRTTLTTPRERRLTTSASGALGSSRAQVHSESCAAFDQRLPAMCAPSGIFLSLFSGFSRRSLARSCPPSYQSEAIWLSLLPSHFLSACSLERAH